MFIEALFIPSCTLVYQLMIEIAMCDLSALWNIIQPQKGMDSGTGCNGDDPWKYCAKWKKPATKGRVLCDSTYVKCPD